MVGARRKGRVAALRVLYELDCTSHDLQTTLRRSLAGKGLPPEAKSLAQELVQGVTENRARLDATIQEYASTWPVAQLSAVDRNILRIAIFEILMNNETPPKAAINEAVDLAKIFGSESLYRFVNGVLGSVMDAVKT